MPARHTVVLSSGTVSTRGGNSNGQLADGTGTSRPSPAPLPVSQITAVAAGGYHTLLLASDGSVWIAGQNSYGQLGLGTNPETDPSPGPPFRILRVVPVLSGVVVITRSR